MQPFKVLFLIFVSIMLVILMNIVTTPAYGHTMESDIAMELSINSKKSEELL